MPTLATPVIARLLVACMLASVLACACSERGRPRLGDRVDAGKQPDARAESDGGVVYAWPEGGAELDAGDAGAEPTAPRVPWTVTTETIVVLPDAEDRDFTSGAVQIRRDGYSEAVRFDVPADAHAFVVSATARAPSIFIALADLAGPGGLRFRFPRGAPDAQRYVPTLTVGFNALPYTIMVPNRPEQAYGPGTYTVRFRDWQAFGSVPPFASEGVVLDVDVVFKRAASEPLVGRVDLLFLITTNALFDAAAAQSDVALQGALSHADQLLATAGLAIGSVTFRDVDETAYGYESGPIDTVTLGAILADHATVAVDALRIVLLEGIDNEGITLGKPAAPGRPDLARASTIILDGGLFATWNAEVVGVVIAHEVGHALGLAHTTERDWVSHDRLLDTPECSYDQSTRQDNAGVPIVYPVDCYGHGLENVMFWLAFESIPFDERTFSLDQAWVMLRHPAVY